MEIVLNVAYGGENKSGNALVPIIRILRKRMKEHFQLYKQEGFNKLKIFLFFNGDLTSYYEKSGLYQPLYFQNKSEFSFTICFDNDHWTGDQNIDINLFYSKLKQYLLYAVEVLEQKLMRKKIVFLRNDLVLLINSMIDSLQILP